MPETTMHEFPDTETDRAQTRPTTDVDGRTAAEPEVEEHIIRSVN